MTHSTQTSSFLWRLLARIYGDNFGDALVGDLKEEYASRKQSNSVQAKAWLLSQFSRSFVAGVLHQCGTPAGLSRIVLITTFVAIPVLLGLVAWLSNMDETTPQLWEMVLAGEMHKTLFIGDFWKDVPFAISQIDSIGMFININSIVWVATAMGLVMYVGNRHSNNMPFATALGMALMVVPYALSIVYLDAMQLPPKKIGPIIAFTLFNFFYMLPLMTLWLSRRAKVSADVA